MKIQLKLHSPPISTNSAYFSRNKAFNEKARKWRADFLLGLQSDYNQNQMKKLQDVFDPKKHMLRCCFTWYQPHDVILTKSGTLSLRSMDVDNCLKIPTDCVFDAKYNDKWLSLRKGREVKLFNNVKTLTNLNINDKFIFDTRSIKLPSDDGQYHCSVDIELVSLFSTPG
jgi:hypothetical protein